MMGTQKETTNYEDLLRHLLGMQAYVLFTYDKAVNNCLRLMSVLKNDQLSCESWRLFKKYENNPSQYKEDSYYKDFLRMIIPGSEPDLLVRLRKKSTLNLYSILPKNRHNHLSRVQL